MEPLEIVVGKKRSLAMSMVERENNSKVQKKKGRVSKRSEEKKFQIGGGWVPAPPDTMSILCWNCRGLRN